MAESALDVWNYTLFSLEYFLNVVFIPVVLLVLYICITQKNLHLNFRVTLLFTSIGYLVCDVARLFILTSRLCCIALDNTPSSITYLTVQAFGAYLSMSAWLLLICERATASVYVSTYELRFKSYKAPAVLSGTVILLTILFQYLSFSQLSELLNFFVMGLQIGIVIVSFMAMIVIIVSNKSSYNKRHDSRIELATRYQLDENIRVGRYLIPIACNDMLTKILFLMLLSYSIFFTNIPLGQDTTHLSHAYDLLQSYQRLFFGLALTLRSEKFDHIMKRHKRTAVVVENQLAASSNYFDELKRMW